MKIDVTQECIDNGVPRSPCGCPLALAFEKAWGRPVEILFANEPYLAIVAFENDDETADQCAASLPAELCKFAYEFDLGRPVEPFSFNVPNSLVKQLSKPVGPNAEPTWHVSR